MFPTQFHYSGLGSFFAEDIVVIELGKSYNWFWKLDIVHTGY